MRSLSPAPGPQLLGTQLKIQNEGTPRQMARLSPVRFLLPPAPDIARYDPLNGGAFPAGVKATENIHLDYYGQRVEDEVESENEDEDDIALIEPAPRRNQFAEESICACCRFSLLKKSELVILDDYAKHVTTQHWDVPYVGIMKVKRVQTTFEQHWNHRGHRATWLYRQVTRGNLLSYLFLASIREEKNIVDNERFTKDVLNVQRKGPSDLQIAAKKSAQRLSESRKSTSTKDSKSRNSTSVKASSVHSAQSVLQDASPSSEPKGSTAKELARDTSVEVTFNIVDGKPSLHRRRKDNSGVPTLYLSKNHEWKRDRAQEEADRYHRNTIWAREMARDMDDTPERALTSPTVVVSEAPLPPTIMLFEPDSDNPSVLDDESPESPNETGRARSGSWPEISISAPAESKPAPVVLFDPAQETIPEGKDSQTLDGSNSVSWSDTATTVNSAETESTSQHASQKSRTKNPPTLSLRQIDAIIAATPDTTTITSASTRRPKPSLPPCSEGPSPKNIWIVIGWFPAEISEPIETCVIVEDPGHFLPELKRHITGLRGWRSVLSFKSVQGFGLYKCRPQQLGHVSHHTTELENLTLSQFFQACNQSYKRYDYKPQSEDSEDWNADVAFIRRRDSMAWAQWVHKNLNASRSCPFRSQLSLKLVLRWSTTRISIASAIPLLMAFVVGFWYSAAYDDPQTAWTIGSFIVTAGAFIIAILAALTSLKDGQATPYPKVRISDSAV